MSWFVSLPLAAISGIVAMSGSFIVFGVVRFWPMPADATLDNARRELFHPLFQELLIIGGAIGCLAVSVIVLSIHHAGSKTLVASMGLLGVFLSWGMLHLMYAIRYAHLYYGPADGGINFNSDSPPAYRDFFYFSYNLGMTYQVSDTDVSSSMIRAVVLRHTLLSYLYGTVLLAVTINTAAGVLTN
ncbi:DUF1345 domain-containing protein [Actinocorallia lasiicapitis]